MVCWQLFYFLVLDGKKSLSVRHSVIISKGKTSGFCFNCLHNWGVSIQIASYCAREGRGGGRNGVNWTRNSDMKWCMKSHPPDINILSSVFYIISNGIELTGHRMKELDDVSSCWAFDLLSELKMLRDDFLQDKLYKNLNIHIKTFLPLIWIIYFRQIISTGQQDRSNIRAGRLLLPFILTRSGL